jgi:meso-butanediol dehydrogenase/(S,S)-butanediol dehydrogenase/diacetyl reductase
VGRIVVITGAGMGLGRAAARRLAKDGDTVILLARTLTKVEEAAAELGGSAMALQCDVGTPDSVRAAFARIAAVHPRIDVLINNAGVYEPFTVAEARDDQILTALNTNFAGPIFCARAAIPMMARGGHIVNVSSESVAVDFPMLSLYQGSKAGLERLTESLKRELADDGIRVTNFRAGPMMDETKTGSGWDMEITMRFHQECVKRGIDLRARPISHYNSVAEVLHQVVNLPADVHLGVVTVEGWR